MFLTQPVHASAHWINFALFVGESTSHVIVSMHILCDVEYSCQRTYHVNLENGLQICEMLRCGCSIPHTATARRRRVLCPHTPVGHKLWDIGYETRLIFVNW